MRRILIFSTNYFPAIGGAEVAVKEITDRIYDAEFDLITARFNRNRAKTEKIGNVLVYREGFGLPIDKYFLPIFGMWRAISLNKRHKYELAWALMASYGGIAAAIFRRFSRSVPLVLTLQEGDEEKHLSRYVFGVGFLYKLLVRPFYRMPFRRADFITTISASLAERARGVRDTVPIKIVPNGVDVAAFTKEAGREEIDSLRASFGIAPSDILIISVSRLVVKNGLGDLIKAAMLLPENHKVLIVGDGPLRAVLEKEIFNLGLSGRVVLVGSRSTSEIPAFLKASDVFVRPSLSEGFGNVFVEAFAAGVPVVATPVGGIVDFLEDKKTGVFCGVSDPTDVALKIGMVVKDIDLRKSLIVNARDLASKKYDWGIVARSMDEVFKKVPIVEKLSIVIATGIYPPQVGGSAEYALNLVRSFRHLGHHVRLVKYGVERFLPSGFRHAVFFVKCLFALRRADFILALDNFSAAAPAVAAARVAGKTSCVRVGGDFLWEQYVERTGSMIPLPNFNKSISNLSTKEKVIFSVIKWVFKKADTLVFSTKWLSEIFASSYALENTKVTIVENFYGPKRGGIKCERKNFVWAGRDIKLKNLPNIEKAFVLARKENEAVQLDTVRLGHDDLMDKIRSSYATISVSLSEVSPNFVIESVYCGKPFITTEYCGIMDRLGETGLYADPNDVGDIKEKILRLAGANGYAECLEKNKVFDFSHSWEEIALEFLRIITR